MNQPPFIFSEIRPGEYIEFFNTTDTAFDLGTLPHWIFSPDRSIPVSSVADSVTLPTDGYARVRVDVLTNDVLRSLELTDVSRASAKL